MKKVFFLLVLCGILFSQSSRVVATINENITVTLSELQGEIRTLPQDRMQLATTKEGVQQILDQIIQRKLLAAQARTLKADTVSIVKEAIKRSEEMLLADFMALTIRANVPPVTAEEARNYYNQNEATFYTSPLLELKQIVTSTKEDADKVATALKAGKNFDELIKQYPGITDGPRSGGLGLISLNQLNPDIVEVVKDLKPGQWGGPVKTDAGYHILYIVTRHEPRKLEYDKISEDLREQLTNLKAQQEVVNYGQSLYDSARITIDNSVLKEAIIQQGGAPGMRN